MSFDTVSNMLSSIKNAAMAKKAVMELNYSKEIHEIAKVMVKRGFLSEAKVFKPSGRKFKMLHLELAHVDEDFKIADVKILSKPGRRVYKKSKELHTVTAGYGSLIVSTSKGIMDGSDAKRRKLGGELICEVR